MTNSIQTRSPGVMELFAYYAQVLRLALTFVWRNGFLGSVMLSLLAMLAGSGLLLAVKGPVWTAGELEVNAWTAMAILAGGTVLILLYALLRVPVEIYLAQERQIRELKSAFNASLQMESEARKLLIDVNALHTACLAKRGRADLMEGRWKEMTRIRMVAEEIFDGKVWIQGLQGAFKAARSLSRDGSAETFEVQVINAAESMRSALETVLADLSARRLSRHSEASLGQ